jgi:hypothetical protein
VSTKSGELQVAGYVIATIASVKAVLDCVSSRSGVTDSSLANGSTVKSPMSDLTRILESIDWEMTKGDLTNAFRYMQSLGPHPEQNGIGFATTIDGVPTVVVCYFQKKFLKEKLAAVNIVIYQEPPPRQELEQAFEGALQELGAHYGSPSIRNRDFVVWVTRGRVLSVGTLTGVLGVRFGDPKIDTISSMIIGAKG